jgi:hypothetical protein
MISCPGAWFAPFGGWSLETGLRLLALVVCDHIVLRPYVYKSEVDAAKSEIINHIQKQKDNTIGRPWAATQAQSKRPPCCRQFERRSKFAPKSINKSSPDTIPNHTKTVPKRSQTVPQRQLGDSCAVLAALRCVFAGLWGLWAQEGGALGPS